MNTVFDFCVSKVGVKMNKKETIKQVMSNMGGIAKTADFIAAGLHNYDVSEFCRSGYITRIKHGYYCLAEDNNISEEQILAALLPEGIVCVESALFYYGYSDFTPRKWTIAVPRTIAKSKLRLDAVPIQPYYIQNENFDLGVTTGDFSGVRLKVYDKERTICDCLKYKTKLDSEMFVKAINAYAADSNKNLSNLSTYAKKMKVYKKVFDTMEMILNG